MNFKTADLLDATASDTQVVLPRLKNFGGRSRFYGRIVTVATDDDNSRVREQLWSPGNGQVLVVDNRGSMSCALLGDMMAAKAVENGWAGIVINGCIRDLVEVSAMDIGVRALATHPRRSLKEDRGETGIEIEFLGARFRPGEYLYSDEDGILLSPAALL